MFEYQTLFDARGALYTLANRMFPEARAEEARQLFSHLDLDPTSRWLDVSAGGGYLSERAFADGFPPALVACDGSLVFLASSGERGRACAARSEALPFRDGAFSGAACLAALHHSEEPVRLISELLRVTQPRGRAAVGDVLAGSPAARFLNEFVDRHTTEGHRGRYSNADSLAALFTAAGGDDARACGVEVSWRLRRRVEALEFARNLFGLAPVTDAELAEALQSLGTALDEEPIRIPWSMVFASARGRGDAVRSPVTSPS